MIEIKKINDNEITATENQKILGKIKYENEEKFKIIDIECNDSKIQDALFRAAFNIARLKEIRYISYEPTLKEYLLKFKYIENGEDKIDIIKLFSKCCV